MFDERSVVSQSSMIRQEINVSGGQAIFEFHNIAFNAGVLVTLTPVTPTCPFPGVTMISPEDGAYYFTGIYNTVGVCNDYTLTEEENHSPPSGACEPTITWKEDLLDVGGGTWGAAQDIHTAVLLPQTHSADSRTLVVQVKAENAEHFAAIDRATITLYKPQDRMKSQYVDSIHAAAEFYGGNDPGTFERHLTAILCHESFDAYEGEGLNQYAWRGASDPNEYCNPIRNENRIAGNTDWGIGQNNDEAYPEGHTIYDPATGQVLWNSVERRRVEYDPFYGIRLAAALLKRAIQFQESRQDLFGGISEEEKWWNAPVLYHRWSLAIFYANEDTWEDVAEADQTEMIIYLARVLRWLDKPCY